MKKTKRKMTKESKIAILKIFALLIFALFTFMGYIYYQGGKGRELKLITVEIETEKLSNAIKLFKALEGEYPDLYGNENNLDSIRTQKGVSFEQIYDSKELATLPSDIEHKVEEKNDIVLIKDGSGGWFYNRINGKIEANLPEKVYK